MKVNVLFKSFPVVIAVVMVFGIGCSRKDAIELYPPVVFEPVPGGGTGGSIADNLVVSVVEKNNGKPIANAVVYVHQGEDWVQAGMEKTGPDGVASFAGKGISGSVTVTVTCNEDVAYDTVSFIGIDTAKLTVPLERRKEPENTRTALTVLGLDAGDSALTLSRNDVPYSEKTVKSGKLEDDPIVLSVPDEPLAFSAMVSDAGGNTTKYGFVVEPDGPLPQQTLAMLNLVRISTDTVRMCNGSIEHPPANLDEPSDGWDPYKRYIFQVFADGGRAGNIVAGFANISNEYSYQAFIVQTPGIQRTRLEVSAMNRSDAWTEMTTAFRYFTFPDVPSVVDFKFMKVPKNLQISKIENQAYPDLIWEGSEGNVTEVEVYHGDYNFHWTLFVMGEGINRLRLPPLEPGAPGSLIADEIYRFQVTQWLVPAMNPTDWTFQGLNEQVTHRAKSTLVKFMVKIDTP
ncbi:hypothetical protein JXA80_06960 [bacterium]|nr:hypothetical protein [candidate division CSSED10-310 bacterium]